uniref:Uncharacterized protein n=1 Tax=Setaria italica TaxID=4555 RepID=K4A1A5_SETIT
LSYPLPHRALDYEPAVLCHCRKKVALWISWSNDNPGRRYLKCYRCDFICWYEGPVDEFICGLLVDLRDVVWSLQCERREHKCAHL